ncbi:MAG: GTPase Era [Dethiobacteria bacterium]|jgi:GTP-binding protein Era|nr:GTPase Era [Bacillota bacterium]
MHRSGFVALVGRPNVGKSTLMNALIGEKAAIISDKPQTTRNRIRGILTLEEAQVIFIDTPGIHRPKHKLGSYMVESALNTLNEVDLVLFLVDLSTAPGKGDRYIANILRDIKTPVFLVLNKADLVSGEENIRQQEENYRLAFPFANVYAVSALKQQNLKRLKESIIAELPEGPQYYPPDMITDCPERFIVAELIREKMINLLRDEVPFAVAVEVEELSQRQDKDIVDIRAVIYTERDSQKGIVIGKHGQMLKKIGQQSRIELENLFGNKVFLALWVKVKKDWRNQERALQELGYRSDI